METKGKTVTHESNAFDRGDDDDDDEDETGLKPHSLLEERITHSQRQKLQLFVANLVRKHVENLCRIRSVHSLLALVIGRLVRVHIRCGEISGAFNCLSRLMNMVVCYTQEGQCRKCERWDLC